MEGDNLKLALRDAGKLIRKKLKTEASKDGFKASGKLNKSFRYRVIANELHIYAEQYAGALSGGIKTRKDANKSSEEFRNSIIKWARYKGITPKRDKKGRFTSYMSMANAIAISIKRRGISERFGYKGSGFVDRVKTEMTSEITDIIQKGFKKDLLDNLNKVK